MQPFDDHGTVSRKFSRIMRIASIGSLAALAALAFAAVCGCERAPSSDGMKEWTAADHDRAEEQGRAANGQQAQTAPEPRGEGGNGGNGGNANAGVALIEVAWSQNCAVCHGVVGKGDGPNGPMVKAGDLTREDWQAGVTDADIAAINKTGKGKMPKFDLPDPVVRGLVGRIRAARGR